MSSAAAVDSLTVATKKLPLLWVVGILFFSSSSSFYSVASGLLAPGGNAALMGTTESLAPSAICFTKVESLRASTRMALPIALLANVRSFSSTPSNN
ncbi:Uu.00g133780.m01.CDS01 [Anthostomella pinea]|uniref:Uu.00g133780.m01.CDS01 n=1 Tax=Anthostomella pinea TaxID=933095 RepID=A0AAI8VPJ0_9PEZI|nr:Uu.00g133780.m01.CDS01 [Anthostomella pinea]